MNQILKPKIIELIITENNNPAGTNIKLSSFEELNITDKIMIEVSGKNIKNNKKLVPIELNIDIKSKITIEFKLSFDDAKKNIQKNEDMTINITFIIALMLIEGLSVKSSYIFITKFKVFHQY